MLYCLRLHTTPQTTQGFFDLCSYGWVGCGGRGVCGGGGGKSFMTIKYVCLPPSLPPSPPPPSLPPCHSCLPRPTCFYLWMRLTPETLCTLFRPKNNKNNRQQHPQQHISFHLVVFTQKKVGRWRVKVEWHRFPDWLKVFKCSSLFPAKLFGLMARFQLCDNGAQRKNKQTTKGASSERRMSKKGEGWPGVNR